jgi:O-antigen/teichoic acid export membrane protein
MFKLPDLLKGSAMLLGASVVARGSTLLFRYLAAIQLSTDDYGRLSLYISLFLSMSSVASFGIGATLAKFAVKSDSKSIDPTALYNNALLLTSVTSLLATLIFVVIAWRTSHQLWTLNIISATAVGFLFWSYFQVSIGFSLADLKFGLASLYDAGDGLVKLSLLCTVFVFSPKVEVSTYVFAYTLSYFILAIFACRSNARVLGIRVATNPLTFYDASCIRNIFRHTFSLMVITFVTLFYSFLLRSFLSNHSTYEVAVFDMAMVFYSIPRMVFASLVRPIVPYASRRSGSRIPLQGLGRIITVFGIIIVAGMGLYYAGLVEWSLRYIGLSEYVQSFPVFLVLLSGGFFDLGFGFMSGYFQGIGKINSICTITLSVFVVLIPLSLYMVHHYRVYGAAVSSVLFTAVLATATALYAHSRIGFQHVSE